MSGFLYAIKKSGAPSTDHTNPEINKTLESVGLEHLIGMQFELDAKEFPTGNTTSIPVWLFTPWGFGHGAHGASHSIDLSQQKWIDCGLFSIGYWTTGGYAKSKPTPVALQRKQMHGSIIMTLGDDSEWNLPVVPISKTGAVDFSDLPTVLSVETGKPAMSLAPFFRPLTGLVEKYWNWKKIAVPIKNDLDGLRNSYDECYGAYKNQLTSESPNEEELVKARDSMKAYEDQITGLTESLRASELPELERALDCVMVLSRNYHVSAYELGVLGTLNAAAIRSVILYSFLDKAAVDLQQLAEKKG